MNIIIIIIITINVSNHLDQLQITSVFDNWENMWCGWL